MLLTLVCYYSFVLFRNGWGITNDDYTCLWSYQHKGTAVSIMYSGIPFGSLLLLLCRWQAMQSGVIFWWDCAYFTHSTDYALFTYDYLQRKVQAQKTTPFFELLKNVVCRPFSFGWVSSVGAVLLIKLVAVTDGCARQLQANYVQMGYNVGGILG